MLSIWNKSVILAAAMSAAPLAASQTTEPASGKPTVVLVHGAFAESASWNGVVTDLKAHGYTVIAVANPLRGVSVDAAYVASVLKATPGPIVLVGHSYGGSVITTAGNASPNVKALVYVAALAPDEGETAGKLSTRFPGSTLGGTLAPPVPLPDGTQDLYIQQDKFHAQFAADVPAAAATQMASTQRPIVAAAFDEVAGPPAWKTIPSWFIWGSLDKNIPPALQPFQAKRAGARGSLEVKGASHVVMVSHPHDVSAIIKRAATAPAEAR